MGPPPLRPGRRAVDDRRHEAGLSPARAGASPVHGSGRRAQAVYLLASGIESRFAYDGLILVAPFVIVAAVRAYRPSARPGWFLVAGAFVPWWGEGLAFDYYAVIAHQQPSVLSAPDLLIPGRRPRSASWLVAGMASFFVSDMTMAEDILQEVLTILWRDPSRCDPDRGSIRTYLGMLTHRAAVDMVRSSARRTAREHKVAADITTVAGQDDIEWAGAIRDAIQRLPDEQRQAVELVFWKGLTNVAAADALGIPAGTLKSRLRLANEKLRVWLRPLALEAT